jgi:hypothetical protein
MHMTMDRLYGNDAIRGRVRTYQVQPGLFEFQTQLAKRLTRRRGPQGPNVPTTEFWSPRCDWQSNTVVYEWAAIVGKLLTGGGLAYRIGGMYIEFENTASPGDPVVLPGYGRTRDIEYYNDLSGSADRDYLRVPLTSSLLDSSDETLFPKGNRMTFFARTQGLQGVHGKPFSEASNSKVFGASLVALVDDTDATQDLILSTLYLTADNQEEKALGNKQIGLEWELELQ